MRRGYEVRGQRLVSTRNAIGLVSDVGGALAALSMLVAISVGVAGAVAGLASDRPGVVLFAGGAVLGLLIGSGCTAVVFLRKAASLEVQRGYRWLRATYTYRVSADDPHFHEQTADIVIRALRDGVRTFSNQYRWSGSGSDDGPIVTSPGHTLAGPIRQSLAWKAYDIHLDPSLRKGDSATVSLLQVLHDRNELFECFLAKTVHEPIRTLILRVELPVARLPVRAWRVTRQGSGPQARQVEVQPLDIQPPPRTDEYWRIEWQVPKPSVGMSYALHWGYRDDRGMYGSPQSATPQADLDDATDGASGGGNRAL
jgi:hypothetical protein